MQLQGSESASWSLGKILEGIYEVDGTIEVSCDGARARCIAQVGLWAVHGRSQEVLPQLLRQVSSCSRQRSAFGVLSP